MATNVVDRFVAVLGYEYDHRGLKKFERGADKARKKLDSVARSAGKIGLALTTAVAGVAQQFAGYETEMSKITGLVGISRDQLAAWQDDIFAIARETGQAPKELAEALFFVTSAGLRGTEAMDVLRSSAKAAAAGLGDQATIVDLVAASMNAYGSDVLSAQQATDALTEAVRLGSLDPPELAAAMGRALAVANAAGVEFSELAGILAGLSKQGINAAEGVTQVRAILNAMNRPAAEAEKMVEAVGLSFEGLRKTVADRGILAALEELEAKVGTQGINRIFPQEAIVGVQAMLGNARDDFKSIFAEMADSTGVLEETFAAGEDTIGRKWQKMMANLQITIIENGDVIAEFANTMIGGMQLMVQTIAKVTSALGPFRKVLIFLGPALLGVSVAAKVLSSAILLVTSVTKVAAAVQSLFTAAALGTRIGMVALEFQALAVAAAQKLATASTTIWTGAVVRLRAAALGTRIGMVALEFQALAVAAAQKLATASTTIWTGAVVRLRAAALGTAIGLAALKVQALAVAFAAKTAAAAQWLWNIAVAAFPVVLIIAAVVAAVAAIWYFRDEILGFLRVAWSKITGVFGAIGGFFADLGQTFYDAGRNLILALVDGIVSAAKAPYDAVKQALGFVGDLLPFSDAREGPLSRLTESGRRIGMTLASGIDDSGGLDLAAAVARILPDPLTLTAPLPVGPVPAGAPAGAGGGRGPVSITLNIERVEINAEGTTAAEVAAEFVGEVRQMVRSVAEEFDSPIDA